MSVIWREAKAEDYPAIQLCHRALEERLGKKFDLAKFDDPAILGWMVAERDGVVVQFLTLEKALELKMGGFDAEALDRLIEEAGEITEPARKAGIRWIHCPVPAEVEKPISRYLRRAQFYKSPNILFAADLRPEEPGAQ